MERLSSKLKGSRREERKKPLHHPQGVVMHRQIFWTAMFVAASVTSGAAQNAAAAKPAVAQGPAGTWNGKTTMGPKDSVVATYTLTIAADGKSATMKFPDRAAMPARVVAMGGDSVVTEAGPYPSVLRKGQTVNLLRTVGHIKGNTMTGTFEAHYSNGDVAKGKTQATRAK
jgi:hypothetical protein